MTVLIMVLAIMIAHALCFCVASGLVWIACWEFGIAFSWKLAIGVYVVLVLVKGMVSVSVTTK